MRRISQLFLFVCIVFSLQAQNATFSGKVFLQGAYDPNTSLMHTALVQQGGLPLLQPYNLAPWYHNGTEVLFSTQAGMVDWILVDLRTSPDTAIARKAAILYTDGTIRDANGDSILHFNVPAGQYYLAIMHRSHLATMTATKHALLNGAILDFVDTTLQVYGTCMIGLGSEKRGLIGGDVNQDRVLKYSGSGNDRSPILQRILSLVGGSAINATTTGYYTEDLRMDGTVKYSGSGNDPSLIIQNLITLTGSNAINSTFTGAVPHALNLDPNCAPQPDQANAGPDSLNIPGTSITLQANQPINGTGSWTVLSGTGGSFADASVHNTLFTGQVGNAYSLIWTISNPCGSTRDTVNIGFVTSQTFTCGTTLTDTRDGQQYTTVQIGNQCWMAKNLNIGSLVYSVYSNTSHSDVSNNGTIEKYCYLNDAANCAIYGGLYDWNEMMGYTTASGIQGICPTGWHIPTYAEWCTLVTFLDATVNCNTWASFETNAGGKMKATGTTHWNWPNAGADNSSGFTALGAGSRNTNGGFHDLTRSANFWVSGYYTSSGVVNLGLGNAFATVMHYNFPKSNGFSVRCLRDSFPPCTPQPTQANAGPDSLNVFGTFINLQANQPVNGTGFWTLLSGTGGSFANSTLHNTLFTGQVGNAYRLIWTITNQCGSKRDTVNLSFADTSAYNCGGFLTDSRDGQQYPTVQIGTQCWMATNLNIGTMVSGNSHQTNNSTIEKYCYNNDANNCATYGGLYQWNEMMGYTTTPGNQGICPPGWHIPTDAEWYTLTGYLGGQSAAGGKMKETGYDHWDSPNTGATNSSGFTALGAGSLYNLGLLFDLKSSTLFWSSSEYFSTHGIGRYLRCNFAYVNWAQDYKTCGYSVRCLRDSIPPCAPQPDQANAGPDSLNIAGTSVILQANQPVNGTGVWTILSGTGGSFADSSVHNTLFTGQVGNAYSLIWTITNQCGSTYDTVNLSFADTSALTCGATLTDTRDGQQYPTVQIGTQCWMAKNLNVGVMVNSINTGSSHSDVSNNGIIEKYCYNNDAANCATYGGLYDWNEMMGYTTTPGTQGICPTGWHIPTDAEWCTLTTYLEATVNCNTWGWSGTNAGGKMKATGTTHWLSPNTGATNSSGFTALGAGYRSYSGYFTNLRYYAYFWSSSEYSSTSGIYRYLYYDYASVFRYYNDKTLGFTVRCLRNN